MTETPHEELIRLRAENDWFSRAYRVQDAEDALVVANLKRQLAEALAVVELAKATMSGKLLITEKFRQRVETFIFDTKRMIP